MRAFVVKELNHPSKIRLSHGVPEPKASENQVLVDVYSAGLNFFDVPPILLLWGWLNVLSFQILQSQGKYQRKLPLPFILGNEFSGKISQDSPIPKGCNLKRGQRVSGASIGSFADKIAVDIDHLIPLPDDITFDQGAGMTDSHSAIYECQRHGRIVCYMANKL